MIVFEDLFIRTKGKPFSYNGKEIKLSDGIELYNSVAFIELEIISTSSEWCQGIIFSLEGSILINDLEMKNIMVIWENTAPKKIKFKVVSKNKLLKIYNVWKGTGGVTHSRHNGAAMYKEVVGDKIIYYCNDGHPNDDFTDLIFSIKIDKEST